MATPRVFSLRNTFKRHNYLISFGLLAVVLVVIGPFFRRLNTHDSAGLFALAITLTVPATLPPTPEAMSSSGKYLGQVSFPPSNAKYFEPINNTFRLTVDELALVKQNGFVVTERLAFRDFRTAYAYIYWKDLPVVVTTDSILHAIHQAYDDILIQLENSILSPKLSNMLKRLRDEIRGSARLNKNPDLNKLYADLETYVTVPLTLLTDQSYDTVGSIDYVNAANQSANVQEIPLFGGNRRVDFTLFRPRGHYANDDRLQKYFRAMSWLGQIDFRFVDYESGKPRLNKEHVAAALLLREMLDKTGQRHTWTEIDELFTVFIGHSDNVTLAGLDRFLTDANLSSPVDVLNSADVAQLLTLLTTNDYRRQRIAGQPQSVAAGGSIPAPQAISFMLFGQRFTVDSYITSSLTFDRLIVDEKKVQRPLPSPLDVMYALGNDRALTHLQPQLVKYGYQKPLDKLREEISAVKNDYWTSSIYNRWLGFLRSLNKDTTGKAFPQSMRTAAWADKMLNTQLASWTQLRHDNVLYVKESFTGEPLCEYPAGYVEPYPEFYSAVQDYARMGRTMFAKLSQDDDSTDSYIKFTQAEVRQKINAYFEHLEFVANRLKVMSEKELRLEPFTPDEEHFLKSVVIHQTKDNLCALIEKWDGWYPRLFPWDEDSPVMIADIHTNLNRDPGFPDLLPPGVLHVAAGDVAVSIFIADTDEGPTMYVGPSFTYYEMLEVGYPPKRLTDDDLKNRMTGQRPPAPGWTTSFRIAVGRAPEYLTLPPLSREPVTPAP